MFPGSETNMRGLRPDQLQEIQQAFHEIDTDRNGYITGEEMHRALQRYHVRFSDFDIQYVLSQMDTNRDGRVSYEEYMRFMSQVYRNQPY